MLWPDRLTASLRRLYRAAGPTSEHELKDMSVPPPALEQDLMARFERRRPAPARAGLGAFVRGHRWALASGMTAVAVAAACQVPYDYDRGFGASVWCEIGSAGLLESDAVRALADHLEQHVGAEQVTVRLDGHDSDPKIVRIDLWGEEAAAAGDDLLAEVGAVPELQTGNCGVEPLVETVHGTLGGRLGLELFDLELLDHDDAEAARAEILRRLEARGLHGDAQVEISDNGDGRREVKIRIEADGELPDLTDL